MRTAWIGPVGLTILLLAGCASGPKPPEWTKPGATEAEFNRDKYECERENTYYSPGAGAIVGPLAPGLRVDKDLFRGCMRARGWAREGDSPGSLPASPPSRAIGEGSGFLLRGSGRVLTNSHVIEGAGEIRVVLRGREYLATVVRRDRKNDLALLSVVGIRLGTNDGLEVDVAAKMNVGEPVYAIGYPLGERLGRDASITPGIISAPTGIDDDPTRFRLSASLNPGNSGGPIVNRHGQVVGIAVSVLRGRFVEGIAFGIKTATAAPILEDVLQGRDPAPTEAMTPEQIFDVVSPWVVRVIRR